MKTLKRQMLPAAASLADAVATAAAENDNRSALTQTVVDRFASGTNRLTLGDLLAATELYQSTFRAAYHRQAWKDWLSAQQMD